MFQIWLSPNESSVIQGRSANIEIRENGMVILAFGKEMSGEDGDRLIANQELVGMLLEVLMNDNLFNQARDSYVESRAECSVMLGGSIEEAEGLKQSLAEILGNSLSHYRNLH